MFQIWREVAGIFESNFDATRVKSYSVVCRAFNQQIELISFSIWNTQNVTVYIVFLYVYTQLLLVVSRQVLSKCKSMCLVPIAYLTRSDVSFSFGILIDWLINWLFDWWVYWLIELWIDRLVWVNDVFVYV